MGWIDRWPAVAFGGVVAILALRSGRADLAYTWGSNAFGQLGNGTTVDRYVPGPVTSLNGEVTAVAAAGLECLAIQRGAIYSWGGGVLSATEVPGLYSGVTAVAGGQGFGVAVQNGGAYAWGVNGDIGDLGNGTTTSSSTPVSVIGLGSGVSAIACGEHGTLAVQNGVAYGWGENVSGSLGVGINYIGAYPTPQPVNGLGSGVTAVAEGVYNGLAIRNGGAYAWGTNIQGELGNGTTDFDVHNAATAVSGLTSGVTAIAVGDEHCLAIQNGIVFAWGLNDYGQLGDGTIATQATPTLVVGLPTDMVEVAAANQCSFALSADGRLWSWGNNNSGYGILGLTTKDSYYDTPQQVAAPPGYLFTSISASIGNAQEDLVMATVAPVPEVGSLAILVGGAAAVLMRRRRG